MKRNQSAASKKAWRTRKRMKAARQEFIESLKTQHHADIAGGLASPLPLDPVVVRRQLRVYAKLMPIPNFGTTLDEDCSD